MTFRFRFALAANLSAAVLLCSALLFAQTEPEQQTVPPSDESGAMAGRTLDRNPRAATTTPVNPLPPDVDEFRASLEQLDRVAHSAVMNLGALQIERWRTDRDHKQQAQNHADSLQRNLTAALPELTQKASAAPGDIAPSFRLYRNLNAVYDVLASVADSAGSYGPKDQYDRLASDMSNLDQIRRSLADRIDTMAGARDGEIATLRARAHTTAQGQISSGVKKVVVDDTAPQKKPAKKKAAPAVPAADATQKQ